MSISRKKILLAAAFIVLLAALFAYNAYGQRLGNLVKPIMESAFNSYTEVTNNPYADLIPDEYYNRMIQRRHLDFTLPDAHDRYKLSAPNVRWWPGGAVVTITYSYEYYVGESLESGSWNVPVEFTLEQQNGQWKIVNYYEAP